MSFKPHTQFSANFEIKKFFKQVAHFVYFCFCTAIFKSWLNVTKRGFDDKNKKSFEKQSI